MSSPGLFDRALLVWYDDGASTVRGRRAEPGSRQCPVRHPIEWKLGRPDWGLRRKVRDMKIAADLLGACESDPEAQLSVIVHVSGPPAQYVDALTAHGVSVERVFRLTSTVAARGPARRVLDLLEEPWVDKIEHDQQITTMM